ncbi:MAG: HAMP domain-containing sensor histidine kinase [Phycisphaerales bacterium]|nr:HAMP domain-containing sensor histidine kinase [Phycisphaerales bacterium]
MKKVYPLIIFLITFSVLGILYIQMSWIKNALIIKQEDYLTNLKKSLEDVRTTAQNSFINAEGYNPDQLDDVNKEMMLSLRFSAQKIQVEEMKMIIVQAMKNRGIKQPFEFCVTNIFNSPISLSEGFTNEMFSESIYTRLTPPSSAQPETIFLYVKEPKNYIMRQMASMIIASILFTIIIISAFALTIRTMLRQKNISEIKSDFINNMTHELKTPLATISLAVDALNNEKVIHDTDKIRYYSGMIKEENKRMHKQVETILQAAKLEKQEDLNLNIQSLDAHTAIDKVARNLSLQIQEKLGDLHLNLLATKYFIDVDEVHFSNIIFNLLDNAIKYSKDAPIIDISTQVNNDMLAIKIKDNGIGMSRETVSRAFEKFYRAHTGNLHNVKGFGLGLSYVKTMVEAQNGFIKLESVLGKGSTFTVNLPLTKDKQDA